MAEQLCGTGTATALGEGECLLAASFLYVFCSVHCNVIIQYKTIKCTFSQLMFLIFNFFLYLLHVSKLRVHLQADGCTYRFGRVCFTCISISSLVDRTVGG